MDRQYVEKQMRGTIGWVPKDMRGGTLPASDVEWVIDRAVDVALALVQEAMVEAAQRMHKKAMSVGCEQGCRCCAETYDILKVELSAIRAAARKPEREGGGE